MKSKQAGRGKTRRADNQAEGKEREQTSKQRERKKSRKACRWKGRRAVNQAEGKAGEHTSRQSERKE